MMSSSSSGLIFIDKQTKKDEEIVIIGSIDEDENVTLIILYSLEGIFIDPLKD